MMTPRLERGSESFRIPTCVVLFLGVLMFLLGGCEPLPATQIRVSIEASPELVPTTPEGRSDTLRTVTLEARRADSGTLFTTRSFAIGKNAAGGACTSGRVCFPGEVVLVPQEPDDTGELLVRLVGTLNDGRSVVQETTIQFQPRQTIWLSMELAGSCVGNACSSMPRQTCIRGACRPWGQVPRGPAPSSSHMPDGGVGESDVVEDRSLRDEGSSNDRGEVLECPTSGTRMDAGNVLAPRMIAPLSTAVVTMRRPTLRWVLAPGTDGVRIELCRDRSCANPIATTIACGSQIRVPNELDTGVVFWRLQSMVGNRAIGPVSPTWQFTVPARSASEADTSWGTALKDINGDGYADILIGGTPRSMEGEENVYLRLGGPTLDPSLRMTTHRFTNFDYPHEISLGDIDGDGRAEVVIADPPNPGKVIVYHGEHDPWGPASMPMPMLERTVERFNGGPCLTG